MNSIEFANLPATKKRHPSLKKADPKRKAFLASLTYHPIAEDYPRLSESQVELLTRSVLTEGQKATVKVVEGTNQIFDGRHRFEVLQRFGYDVALEEVAEAEAEAMAFAANALTKDVDVKTLLGKAVVLGYVKAAKKAAKVSAKKASKASGKRVRWERELARTLSASLGREVAVEDAKAAAEAAEVEGLTAKKAAEAIAKAEEAKKAEALRKKSDRWYAKVAKVVGVDAQAIRLTCKGMDFNPAKDDAAKVAKKILATMPEDTPAPTPVKDGRPSKAKTPQVVSADDLRHRVRFLESELAACQKAKDKAEAAAAEAFQYIAALEAALKAAGGNVKAAKDKAEAEASPFTAEESNLAETAREAAKVKAAKAKAKAKGKAKKAQKSSPRDKAEDFNGPWKRVRSKAKVEAVIDALCAEHAIDNRLWIALKVSACGTYCQGRLEGSAKDDVCAARMDAATKAEAA